VRITTWLLLGVIGLTAASQPATSSPSVAKATAQSKATADRDWLIQRYESAPVARGPDPQTLAPIVRGLRTRPQEKLGWWQRLQQWLHRLAQPREQQAPGWFARLISALLHTPRWVRRWLLYGGVVVTVVLSALLIWREARIAWAQSRRARGRGDLAIAQPRRADKPLSLSDVDAAPASEQSIWLLRLLIQTLLARGLLRVERGLTHGELIAQSALSDLTQRQYFARLARLAERRRYADERADERAADPELAARERQQTLDEGRQLYRQLAGQLTGQRAAQPAGPVS
jgi:hypothetical protein